MRRGGGRSRGRGGGGGGGGRTTQGAVRGAIPRAVVREVAAATYHQVWWPSFKEVVYEDVLPVWRDGAGYVDPVSGRVLRTWDAALDAIDADEDAVPAHVVRFGSQVD